MGCTDSKPKYAVGDSSNGTSQQRTKTVGILNEQHGDVRDFYRFDKVLGKGNFGVVHLVFDKKTNQQYACKSISKRKLIHQDDIEDVQREVQIMSHLSGHKHVVKLICSYEDATHIHFVMECCGGGELFDRIAQKGHFSEKAAAELMRTIISVVHHCHTMNVIHRDLKPENFLFSAKGPDGILKATDFGLSRFFKEGEYLDEIVGSPFYVAPEVLRRKYGKEADIWSCGVILYTLLCGWPPFSGDSTQAIFASIMSKPLDLKSCPWHKISDAGKDCVRRMLCRDPANRLTAAQLLRHPWMKENGVASTEEMTPEVLTRLQQFGKMNFFKKEGFKVIARSLPSTELQGVKEMFKAIDEDGSGNITVDELREGLRKKGASLGYKEVAKVLDGIDVNGNHKIDYEEFIAATIHLSKLDREELMVEAFKHFDIDNSGHISKEELHLALDEVGVVGVDVGAIMKAADTNGDGSINYEEFCVMMRDNDFEAIVQAKTALKTQLMVVPSINHTADAPPDEEPDAQFARPSVMNA